MDWIFPANYEAKVCERDYPSNPLINLRQKWLFPYNRRLLDDRLFFLYALPFFVPFMENGLGGDESFAPGLRLDFAGVIPLDTSIFFGSFIILLRKLMLHNGK